MRKASFMFKTLTKSNKVVSLYWNKHTRIFIKCETYQNTFNSS